MRKVRRVFGCLSVLLLLASAQEASGAGKGWIEKLSGPGPFYGWESPTFPLWCFGERTDNVRLGIGGFLCGGYQDKRGNGTVMLTFTYSDFESQRNALEYDLSDLRDKTVDLKSWVFSLDVTLHRGLDVGVGLGVNRFSGQVFQPFTKYSLEPLRVVFRPVGLLFPKKLYWGDHRVRLSLRDLLQVKFRAVLFPGGFNAAEFGSIGTFDEPAELLMGYSVTLGIVLWF